MAKIAFGPIVGQASGKHAGIVFSHNAGGPYIRTRAIPTISTTPEALAAKARLTDVSERWQGQSQATKDAWAAWAATNPITDRLGMSRILPANAAWVKLNTRLQHAGEPIISAPPVIPAPNPLATLAQSCDIGLGAFDLTYTPTPVFADGRLFIKAAVTDSQGIFYVRNLLRVVEIVVAAQASPYDHQAVVEARFGALQVDQVVHVEVAVMNDEDGQMSAPLSARTVVVST